MALFISQFPLETERTLVTECGLPANREKPHGTLPAAEPELPPGKYGSAFIRVTLMLFEETSLAQAPCLWV